MLHGLGRRKLKYHANKEWQCWNRIRFGIPLGILFGKLHSWHNAVFRIVLLQYIPRNMHTVFALLCFVVVIHWLIFPYPSGLLHWHCGSITIAPVPAKQPWSIWINTSCEFIMNDCMITTKQSTKNPVHISWDILYLYGSICTVHGDGNMATHWNLFTYLLTYV